MPRLLVFAGPNGSGKSTITERIKTVGKYINADEIKKQLDCSDIEAAEIAEVTREYLVKNKEDFTFETVLSTPRNIDLMKRARDAGSVLLFQQIIPRRLQIRSTKQVLLSRKSCVLYLQIIRKHSV